MSFVLEDISESDAVAFGIAEIDKEFVFGGTRARSWAIDRERNIYLRNVANGGGGEPELRNRTFWTFYWRGELLELRLDMIDGGGERGGAGWSRWSLVWINGGEGLPPSLKPEAARMIEALCAALTAHKGYGGPYSTYTEYRAAVEVSKGCLM
ncbi:hypothetical protein RZA67_02190 [Stenotrophomonas sp. C3(2023)]|uniref:hypothetical protein n=1 Tax=Stenotrophomonas sp. C3(2023) TaxID=3080277 RepID=UPI00293C4088|nr:hypothetical protein [Stenotrophomonas sp. C3(2023)]MDV3467550.1 hypothetical protein [Stenotrophomonas sp. C3(2023)]